jgi:DNA-binding PadR family transcriptional regulator
MKQSDLLPLQPATLHILLALAGRDLHGYGIIRDVLAQSEGRYKLGPGTLYDNLQRLLGLGLVEETAHDSRRRYYRLTSAGTGVLTEEISRLENAIRAGKARLRRA